MECTPRIKVGILSVTRETRDFLPNGFRQLQLVFSQLRLARAIGARGVIFGLRQLD